MGQKDITTIAGTATILNLKALIIKTKAARPPYLRLMQLIIHMEETNLVRLQFLGS